METVLTTTQAAERLGVTPRRVAALITAGRLPANQFGGSWMIQEADLALVAERKVGRPPKPKPADEPAPAVKAATGAAEAVTTAGTPATAAEPLTPKVKAAPKAKRAKTAVVASADAKPKRAGKKAKVS